VERTMMPKGVEHFCVLALTMPAIAWNEQ